MQKEQQNQNDIKDDDIPFEVLLFHDTDVDDIDKKGIVQQNQRFSQDTKHSQWLVIFVIAITSA